MAWMSKRMADQINWINIFVVKIPLQIVVCKLSAILLGPMCTSGQWLHGIALQLKVNEFISYMSIYTCNRSLAHISIQIHVT